MRQLRFTVKHIQNKKVHIQVEALANGAYHVEDSFYVPAGAAEVPVGAVATLYPEDFDAD